MREIAVIISKKALEGVYSIRGIRRNLDSDKKTNYPELQAWYSNIGN
jgi:hypothetical protein